MNRNVLCAIVAVVALALGLWMLNRREKFEPVVNSPSDIAPVTLAQSAHSPVVAGATRAEIPQNAAPASRAASPTSNPDPDAPPAPTATAQPFVPRDVSPATKATVASLPPANAGPTLSPSMPPVASASEIAPEVIAIDVDKVKMSLRDYRTIMGENPIGTNSEIVQAMNGGNPKRARLLQDGLTQNADGELVDRWGKPYFFHQLSKEQMQVRSSGPDRVMWTDDDIISN